MRFEIESDLVVISLLFDSDLDHKTTAGAVDATKLVIQPFVCKVFVHEQFQDHALGVTEKMGV
eukprot:SAG11_NODE_6689_length_1266_cov_0.807198_2_plen_63_part_00